jgi:uncharacterized protein (DUF1786 family)
MNPIDPRLALIAGIGTAIVSSHRVRAVIGRGAGYVAAGTMKAGGAVADAGRDIYEEASEVAATNGAAKRSKSRSASIRPTR